MFTQPFANIFSLSALEEALSLIKSKSSGIDKEILQEFKTNAKENLQGLHHELMSGTYTPQPIKKTSIEKDKTKRRPIAIASIRDKVVQKTLVNEIEPFFDKKMSNKSYGYRRDKSPLKAVNRCRDFINHGYFWVYKSDIDNFFETINHDTLLNLLDRDIQDKRVIRLISLYLQNGGFKNLKYIEHEQGVHQGDILSPLLRAPRKTLVIHNGL